MNFQPDYTNIQMVLNNQRPNYLPLYEHHIDAPFISKVLGEELSSEGLNDNELKSYYRKVIGFWKDMTYDAFDFEAIRKVLPQGMKAYGGCGYGIFEASQDLVGYEPLCLMQYMDPDLFADLFVKIGDLYSELWSWVILLAWVLMPNTPTKIRLLHSLNGSISIQIELACLAGLI